MGKDEDFVAFFEVESERLRRFAVLMCGDASEGADLAQEALARTFARWSKVRRDGAGAYARKIVVNLIRSGHRREAVKRRVSGMLRNERDVGELEHADNRVDIIEALGVLSPEQRATIVLRYFEDRTEAEISVALDRPLGTVKSDIHRSLRRLRDRMEPRDPVSEGRSIDGAR